MMDCETGFSHTSVSGRCLSVCRGSEGSSPLGTDLRVTDLYTAGSFDPDHDAVMRIGGEAPGGGPILSVGMDHMRLDATRRKPTRQPKAVAPGFEGQRHPGDRVAGPGRLIPPAMQQSKLPFWARLQLFA